MGSVNLLDHAASVGSCQGALGKIVDRERQDALSPVFLPQTQCSAMAQLSIGRRYGDSPGRTLADDQYVRQLATLARVGDLR